MDERRAEELNEEQRAVVAHDDGPLLVLAGPGSGKTRVLVERFVRLVQEGRAAATEILVLAYNADAAAQMQRKVVERLGPGEYQIATFHAFAKRTIEELGWMAGLPTSFRLLGDNVEKWQRLEAVLSDLRPSFFYAPTRPRAEIARLLSFIGRAKQEAVSPERIATWADGRRTGRGDPQDVEAERYAQAAAVYAALSERYTREGVADFEDLVLRLGHALRDSAAVRTALTSRYRYVMVDEFQDTDYIQSLVLEQLTPHPHNLVVVADDDQSIYRFRGASLTNIVRFERRFPDAPRGELSENYRCPPPVVDASAAIVALYDPRREKRLRASKVAGPRVRIVSAPDVISEAGWIASECRRLVVEARVLPMKLAILTRARYQLVPIALALSGAGLPFDLHGGGDFFSRDEVKDVLALLRALVDPHDDLALIRLWRLTPYEISSVSRLQFWSALREAGCHVIDAGPAELARLASDAERARFEQLRTDVRELAARAQASRPESLVHSILERTEYVGVTRRLVGAELFQAAANLRWLLDLVTTFALDAPDASPAQLLSYLELASDAGVDEAEPTVDLEGIRLSTAHSAKGLEFQHVFIANAAEQRFPVRPRTNQLDVPTELVEEELVGADPYDEERRLFYVAMTRASESLSICYAASYHQGARTASEPSRYITELRRDVPVLLEEIDADPIVLPPVGARVPPAAHARDEPLTISQLLSFADCPRQFWYAHEAKLPSRQERAPLLGTVIHRVLEQTALRRRAGRDVSADELSDLLDGAWRAERFDKLAWADLKEEAARMIATYLASTAWREALEVEPERAFEVELMGQRYRGRFDRVERRGERTAIVDYKTGNTKTAEELRGDRQFGFYRLAAERVYETQLIDLEAHYLSSGDVVRVEKSDAQLERDGRWIYAITRRINESRAGGDFAPRPSDFLCPPCPFRLVCDEGREFLRRRQAPPGDVVPIGVPRNAARPA